MMDRHLAESLDHWLTTPPEEYGPAMCAVYADGQEWADADGLTAWPEAEAEALADDLERRGYVVEVVPI